jgi:transposase InsO family protein
MAKVLEVSPSGFYGWLRRAPSAHARRQDDLAEAITSSFEKSDRNYGSRKIAQELASHAVRACRNTIARLMRRLGLRSQAQRRKFVVTTNSDHDQPLASNLLDRDFKASAPNQKWVADITYVRTKRGWAYLAAVMDLFSRRIVGWAVSESIDTALIETALQNALASRSPKNGLLHHSDRGCQYASGDYRQLLQRHGIECSMSRRGNCWDNAPMERFFGSLKGECMNRRQLRSLEHLRAEAFKYIEIFYNRCRRHQSLGYVSPVQFENAHRSTMAA